MRKLLIAVFILACVNVAAAEKTKLYTDKTNGFELTVPANLNHAKCQAEDEPCEQFGADSVAKLRKSADYDFILQPRAQALPDAIADSSYFANSEGRASWQVDLKTAKHFAANGWQGIYDTVTCGATDEYGFHPDIAECMVAAITNGRQTLIVKTGIVNDEHPQEIIQMLETLRFTAAK